MEKSKGQGHWARSGFAALGKTIGCLAIDIVRVVNDQPSMQPADQPPPSDPRRNLFWMLISFIGISTPKQGQERRAVAFLVIGVGVLLMLVATAILALFRFW